MHEMRGSLFLCFCLFFNGRLNFQIWHRKAKTPKSHPEGWCSLDCGRFRRGFSSFCFSITMLKKKPGGTQLAARSIAFHIFFSFLCKLNQKNSGGGENLLFFFFFLFLLSQEHGAEGGRAEAGKHSKLQKKISNSNNKQKQKRKKKIQTK